jgi:hypothetical protein
MIIPVHSPDPVPNCQTVRVEIIIAQFHAICTGNFVYFFLQDKCGYPARRLASLAEMPACTCGAAQVKMPQNPTRRVHSSVGVLSCIRLPKSA